jgi:acyl-CoA reductase-like NAD-dependent aldehyde dehydrogenase
MPILREEVFGPVLVAAPFRNIDEVLTLANQSRYGLAGGTGRVTSARSSR